MWIICKLKVWLFNSKHTYSKWLFLLWLFAVISENYIIFESWSIFKITIRMTPLKQWLFNILLQVPPDSIPGFLIMLSDNLKQDLSVVLTTKAIVDVPLLQNLLITFRRVFCCFLAHLISLISSVAYWLTF